MSGPRPPSEVTDKSDLTEDAAGDGCGDGGNERACNARSAERPRKPNCGIRRAFFQAAGCPANTTFTVLPLMAAVGRALVERGQPVLLVAVQALVERLVEAKRDLRLARELRRLDRYACLCLNDIGYVRQDRAEMEVLFTLLAKRYERRSVMITSNLVFSQWNQIFHDDMTATAAIDRVVHHSVILEFTVPSYRAEAARAHTQGEEG